jgi:hypothetical protein
MNATELFHADGKSAGIFYCAKCRLVKPGKEQAEECCKPDLCNHCGKETGRKYFKICDTCERVQQIMRDDDRYAAAEKIPAAEWSGPVYAEGIGCNEGYFKSVFDLLDWISTEEDGDDNVRVWACDERQTCFLDYDRIIEDATQEAHEGFDPDDLNGADELKKAIEIFNEANKKTVTWEPNYKKTILLTCQPTQQAKK